MIKTNAWSLFMKLSDKASHLALSKLQFWITNTKLDLFKAKIDHKIVYFLVKKLCFLLEDCYFCYISTIFGQIRTSNLNKSKFVRVSHIDLYVTLFTRTWSFNCSLHNFTVQSKCWDIKDFAWRPANKTIILFNKLYSV